MKAKSHEKILILEDDPFLGEIYARRLQDIGFEVLLASDPEFFLQQAKDKPYDLFLLDIVLPKMDGFEVLKILRNQKETSAIPIVVISNMDQKESVEKAFSLGATDYIIKSRFSPTETISKIIKILNY